LSRPAYELVKSKVNPAVERLQCTMMMLVLEVVELLTWPKSLCSMLINVLATDRVAASRAVLMN